MAETASAPARRWLRLSMILGVVSGLLIIAQAWFISHSTTSVHYGWAKS